MIGSICAELIIGFYNLMDIIVAISLRFIARIFLKLYFQNLSKRLWEIHFWLD